MHLVPAVCVQGMLVMRGSEGLRAMMVELRMVGMVGMTGMVWGGTFIEQGAVIEQLCDGVGGGRGEQAVCVIVPQRLVDARPVSQLGAIAQHLVGLLPRREVFRPDSQRRPGQRHMVGSTIRWYE